MKKRPKDSSCKFGSTQFGVVGLVGGAFLLGFYVAFFLLEASQLEIDEDATSSPSIQNLEEQVRRLNTELATCSKAGRAEPQSCPTCPKVPACPKQAKCRTCPECPTCNQPEAPPVSPIVGKGDLGSLPFEPAGRPATSEEDADGVFSVEPSDYEPLPGRTYNPTVNGGYVTELGVVISGEHQCRPGHNSKGEQSGCCTPENPCPRGVGDCNSDDDCIGDLVCGIDDLGNEHGYTSSGVDVCSVLVRGDKDKGPECEIERHPGLDGVVMEPGNFDEWLPTATEEECQARCVFTAPGKHKGEQDTGCYLYTWYNDEHDDPEWRHKCVIYGWIWTSKRDCSRCMNPKVTRWTEGPTAITGRRVCAKSWEWDKKGRKKPPRDPALKDTADEEYVAPVNKPNWVQLEDGEGVNHWTKDGFLDTVGKQASIKALEEWTFRKLGDKDWLAEGVNPKFVGEVVKDVDDPDSERYTVVVKNLFKGILDLMCFHIDRMWGIYRIPNFSAMRGFDIVDRTPGKAKVTDPREANTLQSFVQGAGTSLYFTDYWNCFPNKQAKINLNATYHVCKNRYEYDWKKLQKRGAEMDCRAGQGPEDGYMCPHPTWRKCTKHDLQEMMRLMMFDFLIYNMDRWRHGCPGNNNMFSINYAQNPDQPLELVYIDQAQYSLGEGYNGYLQTAFPKSMDRDKPNVRMVGEMLQEACYFPADTIDNIRPFFTGARNFTNDFVTRIKDAGYWDVLEWQEGDAADAQTKQVEKHRRERQVVLRAYFGARLVEIQIPKLFAIMDKCKDENRLVLF